MTFEDQITEILRDLNASAYEGVVRVSADSARRTAVRLAAAFDARIDHVLNEREAKRSAAMFG